MATHGSTRAHRTHTNMAHSAVGSSASINDVCETCGAIISDDHADHAVLHKHVSIVGGGGSRAPVSLTKTVRKPRKPRRTPAMLRSKQVRSDVKVSMISAIPGVSTAKAASILGAFEGKFSRLVGASRTEIARVVHDAGPIGTELGFAVWRALH